MYKYIVLISLTFVFTSCGEDNKKKKKETTIGKPVNTDLSMQDKAISFISNQEGAVMYGSIKLNQLLNKAYYDSDLSNSELLGSAVAEDAIEEIERIKSYVNTGVPLYYVVSSRNIDDMELIVFGGINDSKAIIKEIKSNKQSLAIEDYKDFTLLHESEVAMALTKDQFILTLSNQQERNLERKFKDYFKSFSGKADPTIKTVFNKSKDVTIAYDYGKIIDFYEKVIPSLIGENMEYLSAVDWIKDIDIITSINLAFEKGAISIATDVYSEEMKKWNLFGKSSKEILPKLGPGSPFAGFLANINVDEIQKLWNDYYPDGIVNAIMDMNLGPEIEDQIPPELAAMEATLMKDGLQSFFGGEIGMMFYNIPSKASEIIPEMSIFMSIGSNLKALIDENGIPDKGELNIDIQDSHISVSSKNHAPDGKGPELSSKFSNFGKAPISGFVDLNQIPTNDLPKELNEFRSLIEMLDFIEMNMDMSGGYVTLHFKDKSKNALTQIADAVMELGLSLATKGLFQ